MKLPSTSVLGVAGIYAIVHRPSYKFYIGSTTCLYYRCNEHRAMLRKGIHCNAYLQNAWRKYGENEFIYLAIIILCDCRDEVLRLIEQWCITTWRPQFNIATAVANVGTKRKFSKEHRAKLSEANRRRKGQKCSAEAIQRIAAGVKAKCADPDYRKKMSQAAKKAWQTRRIKYGISGRRKAFEELGEQDPSMQLQNT